MDTIKAALGMGFLFLVLTNIFMPYFGIAWGETQQYSAIGTGTIVGFMILYLTRPKNSGQI